MARAATWAFTCTPLALAAVIASSSSCHASGRRSAWAMEIDSGRPDASAMPITVSSSSRWSGEVADHLEHARRSPSAEAMPASSSAAAVSVGVHSPVLVRWFLVREVVKPSAPASIASRAMRPMATMSAGVASSRSAPRSPITYTRSAPWRQLRADVDVVRAGARARRGTRGSSPTPSRGPRAAPSRGCPRRPPSARSADRDRAGAPGAKPTPQLPMTTVVTPCHDDGVSRSSQVAWPS